MPRRRGIRDFSSDASGLQQAIQNFGESFAEGNIFERRRRAQSERELAQEQIRSLVRARGMQEAFNLLSMGNKQGAADLLTRLGVSVPTRDVTTRGFEREPEPDEDPGGLTERIPFVTSTRREIALETPQEKFEREQAGTEARESRGRRETFELGQEGAEAAEQRLRDRPPQSVDEVFAKIFTDAARGKKLDPEQREALTDALQIREGSEGAKKRFENKIITKLDSPGGMANLAPHEREYFQSNMMQRDVGAAQRAEGRAVEGLDISRKHLDIAREGGARATESQASNERNRVFDDIERARQVVENKYARKREMVSLSPNRQQDLARIDAAEDAELTQVTERMKKRFPKYAPDIDTQYGGGGSGRPAPRPSILDLFNQGPQRQGTPRG